MNEFIYYISKLWFKVQDGNQKTIHLKVISSVIFLFIFSNRLSCSFNFFKKKDSGLN